MSRSFLIKFIHVYKQQHIHKTNYYCPQHPIWNHLLSPFHKKLYSFTLQSQYCIFYKYEIIYRHGMNTMQHSHTKLIPFYFDIKIPSPLKRGVDYGFKKGENWIFSKILE